MLKMSDPALNTTSQVRNANNSEEDTSVSLADALLTLGLISDETSKKIKLAEVQTGSSQEEILKKDPFKRIKQRFRK